MRRAGTSRRAGWRPRAMTPSASDFRSLLASQGQPLVRRICIWSPGVEDTLRDDGSAVTSPGLGFGLSEVIDTGASAVPVLEARVDLFSFLKVTEPTSSASSSRPACRTVSSAAPATRQSASSTSRCRRTRNSAQSRSVLPQHPDISLGPTMRTQRRARVSSGATMTASSESRPRRARTFS